MFLESKVAVMPAGTWGATWSLVAAQQGHDITLYIRNPEDCRILNQDRIYKKVPGVIFPENITAVSNPQYALNNSDVVVLAPNSLSYREFVRGLEFRNDQRILNLTKGLEVDTGFRMSEILEQEHPGSLNRLAVWSGPNIASRIASGESAQAHLASSNMETAIFFEQNFGNGNIQLISAYFDVVGVEFGGALKNVITIARGLIDGLGFGEAIGQEIVTKGFIEMVKLGMAYGANKTTFNGPSGIGDLTASIEFRSRNYIAGFKIANGETYDELIASGVTYEGLYTVKSALDLAKRVQVKTPITNMVYDSIHPKKM